jgi:hypothetical protein
MELDDLKTAWREMERRIDASEAMVVQVRREAKLDAIRTALGRMAVVQALMLVGWIAVAVVAASFWVEHRATPHYLVAGLVVHVYAVATIIFCAVQLFALAGADYAAPVVTLQSRLARLRRLRLYGQIALGLPMWLLWVVMTMIGAEIFVGVDLYRASPGWIHVTLAVGVVGMALTYWLPRRFARTPRGSRFLERVLDDLAGHSLVRVTRQLDEIARFSRE